MDKVTIRLASPPQRRLAVDALMKAPDGYNVTIQPDTRSLQQSAMLHALFGNISKQCNHFGRTLNPVQWKVMFISGHAVATGLGSDMVPGLEGEYVNIRESSAQMGVKRMASLLEYVLAFCTENNVRIPAGKGYEEMAH